MVALAAASSAVRASNRFSQIVLFIYSGVLRLDFHSNKLLYRRFNGRAMGILYTVAATPMPTSQVLGSIVQTVRVPSHSTAQNIKPSIPEECPEELG